MTYIENVFLCLAIPLILSLFFTEGRGRRFTLFVTVGMGVCRHQRHRDRHRDHPSLRGSDEAAAAAALLPHL